MKITNPTYSILSYLGGACITFVCSATLMYLACRLFDLEIYWAILAGLLGFSGSLLIECVFGGAYARLSR